MKNFDPIDILFIFLISCYLIAFMAIIIVLILKYKEYKNSVIKLNSQDNLEKQEDILVTPINKKTNSKTKNKIATQKNNASTKKRVSTSKKNNNNSRKTSAKKGNRTKKKNHNTSSSKKKTTTAKKTSNKKSAQK